MVDLNIQLPDSFLQEEVRDGYLVSAKMKELWAVQLDLLNEFDRVCKKYNLKYILEFGTMLGAVRHKGFIPWDDDLDVSMLREDYDKLMKIGPKEFKEPYFLQSQITEKDYDDCVTKLRRSDTCCLLDYAFDAEGHILHYNQGIFIDIFVMDNVPNSDKGTKEELLKISSHAYYKMRVLTRPPIYNGNLSLFTKGLASYIYNKIRYNSTRNIYLRLERQAKGRSWSGIVGPTTSITSHCRPLNFYDKYIEMPFENMKCPVPSEYDKILRLTYGDYMTPVRGTSGHSIVYFDANRSYKEVLNDQDLVSRLRGQLKR
ncbi:MAG: LicD family protein [Muribaculaceae bacterium]|nr:LicD family protein [Muribaculaceae bacterium]